MLNRPKKDKIYFNTVTRSLPHSLIKLHLATPTSYSVRHSGFPVCCTSVRPSRTEYCSLSRLSFEQLGGEGVLIRPTVLITCFQLHSYTVLYKRKK